MDFLKIGMDFVTSAKKIDWDAFVNDSEDSFSKVDDDGRIYIDNERLLRLDDIKSRNKLRRLFGLPQEEAPLDKKNT